MALRSAVPAPTMVTSTVFFITFIYPQAAI
jgi:hypothetical protein